MSYSNSRKRYTDEFKEDAVNLVIEHGYSCAEAGRRLGINPNNIDTPGQARGPKSYYSFS